jgi:hypothetical protein
VADCFIRKGEGLLKCKDADSKENQIKFVVILSPILSDFKKFEEWIIKADRSRIDD